MRLCRIEDERHGEPEHRALARCAAHPDFTPHHLNKLFTDGKAKAGAAEAARRRLLFLGEFLKDTGKLVGGDADAGVLHFKAEHGRFLAYTGGTDEDMAALGEF